MKRTICLALGTTLCVAPLAFPAQLMAATAAKQAAYKAPRTSFGAPDLGGFWSNASMTPESRPATDPIDKKPLGDRLVYTAAEAKALERSVVEEVAEGNKPSDPNAPAPTVGGDKPAANLRPEFAAAAGNTGGYNRGWLDPGASVMRVHGEPRTSLLTTPNGRAPAKKAGAPTYAVNRGAGGQMDGPESRSLGDRCILSFGRNGGPPMLANGFYNNNYQLIQSKDTVAIEIEMVHDVRIVRMNAPHRTDGLRPYFGDSVGHYEGDTLVVETTNIPQAQAYNGSWKDLKVTERFTRVKADRLLYQFTIDDSTMWDKPWGGEYEFGALGGTTYEYACHEGNYALEGILAGARQAENDAKAKTASATPAAARP